MRFQSLTVVSTILMMALSTMAAPVLVDNLQNELASTNGGIVSIQARSHYQHADPSKSASKYLAGETDPAAEEPAAEEPAAEEPETEATPEETNPTNTPPAANDKPSSPIINLELDRLLNSAGNTAKNVGGDVNFNGPDGTPAGGAPAGGAPAGGAPGGLPLDALTGALPL
ncbi:unnamed protein product [Cunninghamella blakesleeana]